MQPLLVIENDPRDPAGYLGEAIEARKLTIASSQSAGGAVWMLVLGDLTIVVARPSLGDPIPHVDGWAAVIVLGGPQGAYESDLHPYLADEMQLIRDAVAAGVPVLGICLGSQLIAHALGGRAFKADAPEVRVITPLLTTEAAGDPIATLLATPVVTFHQDTFDLPPHAIVLARSDRFTQAFRCGSALAIQPHPEASADRVASWLPKTQLPQQAGVDGMEVVAAMRREVRPATAIDLFDAWLDEISTTV